MIGYNYCDFDKYSKLFRFFIPFRMTGEGSGGETEIRFGDFGFDGFGGGDAIRGDLDSGGEACGEQAVVVFDPAGNKNDRDSRASSKNPHRDLAG